MNGVPIAVGVALLCATTAYAQPAPSSDPVRRLDLTVQVQPLPTGQFSWFPPAPKPLGVLTLLPAAQPGEIVKFSLPVGRFAARGVRAITTAQRRRAEREAQEKVRRELERFGRSVPTPRMIP
jgi:hypothetical protein